MDRAGGAAFRRRNAGAAARRGNGRLEARLAHPVFDSVRPWLERLADPLAADLAALNRFAGEANVRTASGKPLHFALPAKREAGYGEYEMRVFDSGCVETRPGSRHDLFNALAWLAFPKTKAALNARHAAEIPRERGRRGRLRDLLTLLDEGGAIVACSDEALLRRLAEHRWKALFWEERDRLRAKLRVHVLGHAVLEQALEPWAGITCKAVVVAAEADPDVEAAQWLQRLPREASPRDVPPLPIFGMPGWMPGSEKESFYEDGRYFRPASYGKA